ncbi:hypothetical protein C8R44DRAFT_602818 [Mycena epipterygia]|nr:hypothetical protein C8R44DRAFT_602818 [Mycena epipterygia]
MHVPRNSRMICHCTTDCKKNQRQRVCCCCCVVELQKDVKIEDPVKTYQYLTPAPITHIFCSNCGSHISHKTPRLGESQAIHTGLFSDFTGVPIAAEFFVKSRWNVVPAVKNVAQIETMPPA